MRKEEIQETELDVEPGTVLEVTSMKELGAFLGKKDMEGICKWWRVWMGYVKDEEGES
jgi:hypothetical protein